MPMQQLNITKEKITLNGKPFFILAAEFHYYAVPEDLWANSLAKYRALGINCVSICIPWAFHEPEEGEFQFLSPNLNLLRLFETCESNGLFVIIRIGPKGDGQLENLGYPHWLFKSYPHIFDQTSGGLVAQDARLSAKMPYFLHELFLERVQRWYGQLLSACSPQLFPNGPIILLQLDDEIGDEIANPYFSFGYHPDSIEAYQKWCKGKYLLIEALNEAHAAAWTDFEGIDPPRSTIPLLDPLAPSPSDLMAPSPLRPAQIVPLLDWLEFKEFYYASYFARLVEFVRHEEVFTPIYINISSYKSPVNTRLLTQFDGLRFEDPPVIIGFGFYPAVFHSQVNEHCYTCWHSEWLKTHADHPPFIAKFQEYAFEEGYDPRRTHNLLRLVVAHGAQGISFNMPVNSQGSILEARGEEIRKFARFLALHAIPQAALTKIYDPLTVAYYHPVTRLKSLPEGMTTKDFGFPIDYEALKYHYKSFLQLLTKHHIQYRVINLESAEVEVLNDHPFIMLYYLGWMYHADMLKLAHYVENGGCLITFGDIPMYNEYMEPDFTLYDIYLAECECETNPGEHIVWYGETNSESLNDVRYLFRYRTETSLNLRTLAHDDEYEHIYAFSRQHGLGKVVHSGIMVSAESTSVNALINLLEEAQFPTKNITVSSDYPVVLATLAGREKLVLVGNLHPVSHPNQNFSFYLPDVEERDAFIEIDGISVTPNVFSFWHLNKALDEGLFMPFATAELCEMRRESGHITLRFEIPQSHDDPDLAGQICLRSSYQFLSIVQTMQTKPSSASFSQETNENGYHLLLKFWGTCGFEFNLASAPSKSYTFLIEARLV